MTACALGVSSLACFGIYFPKQFSAVMFVGAAMGMRKDCGTYTRSLQHTTKGTGVSGGPVSGERES